MGNHKISITAEFVSLIKLSTNEKYGYFISKKSRRIFDFISAVVPKSVIEKIFFDRMSLSREFDDFIEENKFETIIEFGCGYSLRGFEYATRNRDKIYIDTDFGDVIETKRKVFNSICEDYKISIPGNYIMLAVDVLQADIEGRLRKFLKARNLFVAEGLTTYFSLDEYKKFIEQIKPFLKQSDNVFFSHENFIKKHSFAYMLIRRLVSFLTKSGIFIKFGNKEKLVEFLKKNGIENCQAYYKNNHLFYRIN
jgi:O-methyltransferase involved in polyketide biosynthesis